MLVAAIHNHIAVDVTQRQIAVVIVAAAVGIVVRNFVAVVADNVVAAVAAVAVVAAAAVATNMRPSKDVFWTRLLHWTWTLWWIFWKVQKYKRIC